MPPRRRAPAPPPVDLVALSERLSAGSVVRVGLAPSAQFPDGGSGRVRTIGDPRTDGEEFVQVEVTVNGTRDVLPFAPGDLRPVTRAPRSTRKPDLVSLPGIGSTATTPEARASRNGSGAAHLASRSGLAGDARTGLGSAGASHTMFFESQTAELDAAPLAVPGPSGHSGPSAPPRAAAVATPVVSLVPEPAQEATAMNGRPARKPDSTVPTRVDTGLEGATGGGNGGTARRATATRRPGRPASPAEQTVVGGGADVETSPGRPAAGAATTPPGPRGRAVRRTSPATPASGAVARQPAPASGETGPARRGGRLPAVSITVSTTPEEPTQWRIDAKVGAKAVVRSEGVPAARVWEMVEGMRTPALSAAVGALLDEHRRLTQARAEALAAELAGLRAELDSLPDAPAR